MTTTSATLYDSIQPRGNTCRLRWHGIDRGKVIRKDEDGWRTKEEWGETGVVLDMQREEKANDKETAVRFPFLFV